MSKMMDIRPTPGWTAWLYATARAYPEHYRLVFDEHGGEVVPIHRKAPNIIDQMHRFAGTHRDYLAEIDAMLPRPSAVVRTCSVERAQPEQ